MSGKYRYDHRTVKKHHFVGAAVLVCLVIVGIGIALIIRDIASNSNGTSEGSARVVGQVAGENAVKKPYDQPTFTLQIPSDWKQTATSTLVQENSVTISQLKPGQSERSLKIFVDTIPSGLAVNRMLPVSSNGTTLTTGDVSENCTSFTQGVKIPQTQPALARWQGVDFMCDLENTVDNKIGTSSKEGINSVTVSGLNKGAHKYFFLYIDRNTQPDYTVLAEILSSFQAK